jgi:pimeloyl-ACP methyl ester carboxylesterase
LFRDPTPHPAHPAETIAKAIPSENVNLNALFYTAAGPGPHPTILLLHGLPGNEQNIDLAQAARRAGWNVLTLHYRGSWGTPGTFSFAHCIADAVAALDWLASGGADANSRIDASRLVLIGHSMGGYLAAHVAAGRADLLGTALLSPANIGTEFGLPPRRDAVGAVDENVGASEGLHILAGTSPEALAREASDNAATWRLERHAPGLAARPVLLITSDDGFTDGSNALSQALQATGSLTAAHFATDHSYSDCRIGLQAAVLRWLEGLEVAADG